MKMKMMKKKKRIMMGVGLMEVVGHRHRRLWI
jgi:hypothetical protein